MAEAKIPIPVASLSKHSEDPEPAGMERADFAKVAQATTAESGNPAGGITGIGILAHRRRVNLSFIRSRPAFSGAGVS